MYAHIKLAVPNKKKLISLFCKNILNDKKTNRWNYERYLYNINSNYQSKV